MVGTKTRTASLKVQGNVVTDHTLNVILNWIVLNPTQFGCGITWLTEVRIGPVPGSLEETHGFPDGHTMYREEPWVGWFLLPTQVSRFRMVRAVGAYEVKLALIHSALGLAEPVNGEELLTLIDRKAATLGLTSPLTATERVLVP